MASSSLAGLRAERGRPSSMPPPARSTAPAAPFATISAGDALHSPGATGRVVDSSGDTMFDTPTLQRDIRMRGVHLDVDGLPIQRADEELATPSS